MKNASNRSRTARKRQSVPLSLWLDALSKPLTSTEQQALERVWKIQCERDVDRETLNGLRAQRRDRDNPLSELVMWLRLGCYPPPEVLIGLHQRFGRYLQARGKMDLETALIERPKQRAGNFAKRLALHARDVALAWEVGNQERDGGSHEAAAERALESLARDMVDADLPAIDAASLARQHRTGAPMKKHTRNRK